MTYREDMILCLFMKVVLMIAVSKVHLVGIVLHRKELQELTSSQDCRVGRLRLIFRVPVKQVSNLFPGVERVPAHLAYIEWFTPFTRPDVNHGLYRILHTGARTGDQHVASVVEVKDIQCSCHLWPDFGPVAPREWSSDNVLDRRSSFFVSVFNHWHAYQTMV